MKKVLSAVFVLSFGLMVAGSAQAQYTESVSSTLDVSATVAGVCAVTTTAIDFGLVDGTVQVDAAGGIEVTCTSGLAYAIALDAGGNLTINDFRSVVNGASGIEYALYSDAGRMSEWGDDNLTMPYGSSVTGDGTGLPDYHVVYASLFAAPDPSTLLVGTYNDVVGVTVHY